jgi:hypothetical protein
LAVLGQNPAVLACPHKAKTGTKTIGKLEPTEPPSTRQDGSKKGIALKRTGGVPIDMYWNGSPTRLCEPDELSARGIRKNGRPIIARQVVSQSTTFAQ